MNSKKKILLKRIFVFILVAFMVIGDCSNSCITTYAKKGGSHSSGGSHHSSGGGSHHSSGSSSGSHRPSSNQASHTRPGQNSQKPRGDSMNQTNQPSGTTTHIDKSSASGNKYNKNESLYWGTGAKYDKTKTQKTQNGDGSVTQTKVGTTTNPKGKINTTVIIQPDGSQTIERVITKEDGTQIAQTVVHDSNGKVTSWAGGNVVSTIPVPPSPGDDSYYPSEHYCSYSSTVVPATCTSEGYTLYYCSCGSSYTSGSTPALGHNYLITASQAPTCTTKGVTTYTCSRCGDSYVSYTPALGHLWPDDYSYADNNNIKNGLKYKNCSRCGQRLETLYLVKTKAILGTENITPSEYHKPGEQVKLSSSLQRGYHSLLWNGFATTPTFKMPSQAVTMISYATTNMSTLIINPNGGTWNGSDKVSKYKREFDGKMDIPLPIRKGYTFTGWTQSDDFYGYIGSLTKASTYIYPEEDDLTDTLTANWQVKTFTIDFDPMDGIVSKNSKQVTYGEKYGTLPTPTLTDYIFLGWFTESEDGEQITSDSIVDIDNDTTLYAHWTLPQSTLEINPNGGKWNGFSTTQSYKKVKGETLDIPLPTRTGYTFVKWEKNNDFHGTLGSTTKDTTYTYGKTHKVTDTIKASWKANAYKVTFEANGGTCSTNSKYVTYGGTYGTLPTPTKEGSAFAGWYTEENGGNLVTSYTKVSILENQTLYAHWVQNASILIVDPSGGTYNNSSLPTSFVKPIGTTISLETPICPGYKFTGWDKSENFNGSLTNNTSYTFGNVQNVTDTLTATWTEATYIISFNGNGGIASSQEKEVTYNKPYGTLPTATRKGYDFLGWTTSKDGNVFVNEDDIVSITQNTTLYAKYEPHKDIMYKVNHYQMNLDGETYTLVDSETLKGVAGSVVTPEGKDYNGFTLVTTVDVTISGDGSTVVNYYYRRNKYKVTITKGTGIESVSGDGIYYFGQNVTIDATLDEKEGYVWDSWAGDIESKEKSYTFTMPKKDINIVPIAKFIQSTLRIDLNGGEWVMDDDYFEGDFDYSSDDYVERIGNVNIVLKDIDTEKAITGAAFSIIDKDNNVVESGKTNGYGMYLAEGLVIGDYKVHITSIEDGCIIPEDVPFTIVQDDVVVANVYAQSIGNIDINVVNQETNEPLAGVELAIISQKTGEILTSKTDEEGNTTYSVTTDETGHYSMNNLNTTDYRIEILSVPEGFEVPELQLVTVTRNKTSNVEIQVAPIVEPEEPENPDENGDNKGEDGDNGEDKGDVDNESNSEVIETPDTSKDSETNESTEKTETNENVKVIETPIETSKANNKNIVASLLSSISDKFIINAMAADKENYKEELPYDVYDYVDKKGEVLYLSDPIREGYIFKGWEIGDDFHGKLVKSDDPKYKLMYIYGDDADTISTLKAKWEPITYTIRFASSSKNSMPDIVAKYDEKIKLPKSTYKEDHFIFAAWEQIIDESEAVSNIFEDEAEVMNLTNKDGDIVYLYPNWYSEYAELIVDPNGGTYNNTTDTTKYEELPGTTIKLENPTKTGFTFLGWQLQKYDYGTLTTYDTYSEYKLGRYGTSCTLTAMWAPIDITVTLDPNGGTISTTQMKVVYGEEYGAFPIPTKDNDVFVTWYLEDMPIYSDTIVTTAGHHTLVAHWLSEDKEDGKKDVNIDINGDGKADINIDTDGDGKPDINIDTNGDGKPDINIDIDGDGKPDINIDKDGDGKPDINIDIDGDGKPDKNVDKDGDGKPDTDLDPTKPGGGGSSSGSDQGGSSSGGGSTSGGSGSSGGGNQGGNTSGGSSSGSDQGGSSSGGGSTSGGSGSSGGGNQGGNTSGGSSSGSDQGGSSSGGGSTSGGSGSSGGGNQGGNTSGGNSGNNSGNSTNGGNNNQGGNSNNGSNNGNTSGSNNGGSSNGNNKPNGGSNNNGSNNGNTHGNNNGGSSNSNGNSNNGGSNSSNSSGKHETIKNNTNSSYKPSKGSNSSTSTKPSNNTQESKPNNNTSYIKNPNDYKYNEDTSGYHYIYNPNKNNNNSTNQNPIADVSNSSAIEYNPSDINSNSNEDTMINTQEKVVERYARETIIKLLDKSRFDKYYNSAILVQKIKGYKVLYVTNVQYNVIYTPYVVELPKTTKEGSMNYRLTYKYTKSDGTIIYSLAQRKH